jgi:acyl-CoA reductase-like NAD-dependent aldehyde dehydrogenase
MAANGISNLATKALKQAAKLAKATAKRQGKTVADDGTITGAIDSTKNYYRARNTLDITQLPTQYSGNDLTDNANTGGLVEGRPWTT